MSGNDNTIAGNSGTPGSPDGLRKITRVWLILMSVLSVGPTVLFLFMIVIVAALGAPPPAETLAVPIVIALIFNFVWWTLYATKRYVAANAVSVVPWALTFVIWAAEEYWVDRSPAPEMTLEEYAEQEEQRLAKDGGETEDWQSLASTYTSMGRYQDAADIYKRIVNDDLRVDESQEFERSYVCNQADLRALTALGDMYSSGNVERTALEKQESRLMPDVNAGDEGIRWGMPREQYLAGLAASVLGYEQMAAACWEELLEADQVSRELSEDIKNILGAEVARIRGEPFTIGELDVIAVLEISTLQEQYRSGKRSRHIYIVDPDSPQILKGYLKKLVWPGQRTEVILKKDFPDWSGGKATFVVVESEFFNENYAAGPGEWYGVAELSPEESVDVSVVIDQQQP